MKEKQFIQFDYPTREVSISNLYAMCDYSSGTVRSYYVYQHTKNRIHVAYTNPDEYGNTQLVVAVFVRYNHNPEVVIFSPIRYYAVGKVNRNNPYYDGDWIASCFDLLLNCPVLWRNPDTKEWKPEEK